jgi:hypothetical protein
VIEDAASCERLALQDFTENHMKKIALSAALLSLTVAALSGRAATVKGTYVEARTSEVFAGACVVNAEVGTTGREALLAWKVDEGRFNGVSLAGLSVVAAVSGDMNLSMHEVGGDVAKTRTALFLDARATDIQRKALVAMATTLAKDVIDTVVEVSPASIEFVNDAHEIRVATKTLRLVVDKHLDHDVTCGNKQWFQPLAKVDQAEMGGTTENTFDGASLGTKWSDPNKRSAFFGTFSY